MAHDPDPYRTLGLPRGASLDEVKRAYRRLAKEHHPDAAGHSDLKRFLAIQTAYDQLAGPGAATRGGAVRRSGPTSRPWDADRDRADATHRAYAGRERRNRTTGTRRPGSRPPGAGTAEGTRGTADGARGRADGAPGTADATGSAGSGSTGSGGAAGDAASGRGRGSSSGAGSTRGSRPPKKATLGSTSYDGADDQPFEPDWAGASWYGTTSGTYWTLNPREYADPRKHGPEYQARARRAAADGSVGATGAGSGEVPGEGRNGSGMPPEGGPEIRETASSGSAGPPPSTPPTHSTTSWWDATAADPVPPEPGARSGAADAGRGERRPRGGSTADDEDGRLPGSPWDAARWLEAGPGGAVGRVGLAFAGWAPIALGIGWITGEITGCARFAADCDANAAPVAWFVQLTLFAVLLFVPRLALIATSAAIGTLAVAVPGAVLLSATGGATEMATGRTVLSGLLLIGWVVGLALGVARLAARLRAGGP